MLFFKKKKIQNQLDINVLLDHAERAFKPNIKAIEIDNVTMVINEAVKDLIRQDIEYKGFIKKKTINLDSLQEFSPLMCHFVKNDIVNQIRENLYNKRIPDDTQVRFSEVVKDLKDEVQYIYINTQDQVPVTSKNIQNKNIKTASQLVETFKIPIEVESRELIIEIPIYIGSFIYMK